MSTHLPDAEAPTTGNRAPPFRWCPIRALAPRHRPRILAHLLALGEDDRRLRFGYAATDAHIGRYVDQLDFERDEIAGVFNRRLELVALVHLAYLGPDLRRPSSAEFGVSVLPGLRGRGLGQRLFEHACLHARNRGVETLVIHALTENVPMLRIARRAGAVVERDGPESVARLRLPRDDVNSQLTAFVEHQAAEVDYGLKVQARRIDSVWTTMRQLLPGTEPIDG